MKSRKLKRIVKEIENNIEEMELFVWVNSNVDKIQVEEIIQYYEEV